jgi:hypothetical protein
VWRLVRKTELMGGKRDVCDGNFIVYGETLHQLTLRRRNQGEDVRSMQQDFGTYACKILIACPKEVNHWGDGC